MKSKYNYNYNYLSAIWTPISILGTTFIFIMTLVNCAPIGQSSISSLYQEPENDIFGTGSPLNLAPNSMTDGIGLLPNSELLNNQKFSLTFNIAKKKTKFCRFRSSTPRHSSLAKQFDGGKFPTNTELTFKAKYSASEASNIFQDIDNHRLTFKCGKKEYTVSLHVHLKKPVVTSPDLQVSLTKDGGYDRNFDDSLDHGQLFYLKFTSFDSHMKCTANWKRISRTKRFLALNTTGNIIKKSIKVRCSVGDNVGFLNQSGESIEFSHYNLDYEVLPYLSNATPKIQLELVETNIEKLESSTGPASRSIALQARIISEGSVSKCIIRQKINGKSGKKYSVSPFVPEKLRVFRAYRKFRRITLIAKCKANGKTNLYSEPISFLLQPGS